MHPCAPTAKPLLSCCNPAAGLPNQPCCFSPGPWLLRRRGKCCKRSSRIGCRTGWPLMRIYAPKTPCPYHNNSSSDVHTHRNRLSDCGMVFRFNIPRCQYTGTVSGQRHLLQPASVNNMQAALGCMSVSGRVSALLHRSPANVQLHKSPATIQLHCSTVVCSPCC